MNSFLMVLMSLILSLSGCDEKHYAIDDVEPNGQDTISQYGEPFQKVPETEDIIMYEVNPLVFSESADLEGIQSRLDELKDLGVNVVWLMPIYPIGQENAVGSPYAVRNYTKVNSDYGTLEDLRTLVEEAHSRDMAVILDWVANHTAWDHPWMENKSWYEQDENGNIVYPEDWEDVASLNYEHSDMQEKMIAAMKYWVLEANVDGYRCDYAKGVPHDFWSKAIDTLRSLPNRDLIMFAEATDKDLFDAGFDLTFGWDFYDAVKNVYNNDQPTSILKDVHASDYANVQEEKHVLRFTDNHDFNAWEDTPLEIFEGKEGSITAFVVSSYMGGVPMLYNGQEVGCPKQLSFFHSSSPKIDWTINPGMKAEYKKIIKNRKNSKAVKSGRLTTYTNNNDIAAFKRASENEQVLIIANIRGTEINYQLPEAVSNTTWTNAMKDSEIQLGSEINLEAYQYFILKKN
ncbi:MAG: alpha-glucosidase C-terminal domain-containing protein [Bacteroidales bacterium]|nr:alpha-glucosidase C-terminal domain-containing protein [Bacteroidales bacterium]MCF8337367.1 alpha-glucosidase C-terminal domain-containing protein [Bacteroidales bacterium]